MLRPLVIGRRRIVSTLAMVGVTVVLALGMLAPPLALGQATRTFISGLGNDADPCSRTAPCRTFAGAFNRTAPNGEINCLDPGGYGGLTINKSIIINCEYTLGGSLVAGAGVNGITVNAGATDVVFLRGIDFQGAGTATNGIRILAGGAVHIQDSIIKKFNAANGTGIRIAPSTAVEVFIENTTIADNGTPTTGSGILIQPTGAGTVNATLVNVQIENNKNGLFVDGVASTGPAMRIAIIDSDISQNVTNGIRVLTDTTGVGMMIDGSSMLHNLGGSGILCDGAGCLVRVGRTSIFNNSIGTQPMNGGVIESYQSNHIRGNSNNGSRTNITQE